MAIYDAPESLHVGTGTETVFGFNWPYLLPRDLLVTVNGMSVPVVLAAPYQVSITPAPAALAVVRIYRNTPAQNPLYLFATGIPMLPKYIDGNNKQLLYALQEGLLQFRQTQETAEEALRRAEAAELAALAAQLSAAQQAADMRRTVRVPTGDPEIPTLPPVAARRGKVMGFNTAGEPVGVLPASGSGTELALDLADTLTPGKGIGMIGAYGETLQAVLDRLRRRVVFSKMIADGTSAGLGTDNTAVFQSELSALRPGDIYITPPGYCVITHALCPSVRDVHFEFTATRFILKSGFDPLDREMLRFGTLTDCHVAGFYTDGNVANVPDAPLTSDLRYGRVLNWRLGNFSTRTRFTNLSMVNSQYCGAQWGSNIKDIVLDGIYYDNIGEHVFYISGQGGGLNTDLEWLNTRGGSFGVNPRNTVGLHECSFIKSFQTVGLNNRWRVRHGVFEQAVPPTQAATLVINQDLLALTLEDIHIGDNIGSLLYPRGRCDYVTLRGIRKLGAGTAPKLIHSHVDGLSLKRWVAHDMDFTNSYELDHIQLFDLITDSILPRWATSATRVGEFATGRVVRFERVRFDKIGYARYFEHDFVFVGCTFRDTTTGAFGAVEAVGETMYTNGKWLRFEQCRFVGGHSYSASVSSAAARVAVVGCTGPVPQLNARNSVVVQYVLLDDVEVVPTLNPLARMPSLGATVQAVRSADGSRNWGAYTNTWSITTGQTSVSFPLGAVLAAPFAATDVAVSPANSGAASSNWWVTVADATITITVSAPAAAPLQFHIKVKP